MTKFLIADDHPLFREALVGALTTLFTDIQIVESACLNSTMKALQENQDIDLVLLDLNMPDCENLYGLVRVTKDFPDIPVAVVSASDSVEVVAKVMSIGAKGFISKSSATLTIANALKQIMLGQIWLPEGMSAQIESGSPITNIVKLVEKLTSKQREVLKLVQDGLLNKQIAYELSITEATVKAHISAVLRKLEVNTRTQAVLLLKSLNIND
jgi:DNA-binding NarL/FixJ family response regulator